MAAFVCTRSYMWSACRRRETGKRENAEIIILFSISRKVFFFFFQIFRSVEDWRSFVFFLFFPSYFFFFCFCFLNWRLECYGVVGNSGGTVMKMKLRSNIRTEVFGGIKISQIQQAHSILSDEIFQLSRSNLKISPKRLLLRDHEHG